MLKCCRIRKHYWKEFLQAGKSLKKLVSLMYNKKLLEYEHTQENE